MGLNLLLTDFLLSVSSPAADMAAAGEKNTGKEIRTASDLAAGIVDAGEVRMTVFNNGLLGTWGWSSRIIPQLPAGWYKGYGYIPDMNIWLGAPEGPWTPVRWDPVPGDSVGMGPTVSEAELYGGTDQSDWGPWPGSLGVLHSGTAVISDVVAGSPLATLPLVATSTIPASWPLDEGRPFWPGPWGCHPVTGLPTEGLFVSEQDHFFSITDGPYADRDGLPDQGYPLDVRVDVSVCAFDAPYEDIIYYSARLINLGSHDYSGLYAGIFFDADIPEYDEAVMLNDRFDWTGLDRDQEVAYVYDYRWGTGLWPEGEAAAYQVHAGLQFLKTPRDRGLTDWHWFEWENRPGVVLPERQERIQFAVLSGDTSGLEPAEEAAYFHADAAGRLDPHFDSAEQIPEIYPRGLDCAFLMSTGPFDLSPADTLTFEWALVMGDDLEDLLANARLSRELSDNRLVRIHPRIADVGVEVTPAGPNASRILLTVETYDHDGLSKVTAWLKNSDGSIIDSLALFDDGDHDDGAAGDSVYGNFRVVTSNMQRYGLDILSTDALSNRTRVVDAASFWAGPGVVPPRDLKAQGQEEAIYLSWSPSTDEATFGYNIYYDTDGPDPPFLGDGATQGQSPVAVPFRDDSTLVLTGLEDGETYYLTLTAYDTAGHESGFPETVAAVPGTHLPPSVAYRALSRDRGVELDWSDYASIAPADVKSFHIYRSDDIGLTFTEIAATGDMTFLDSGLSNNFPYMYRVTVEDQAEQERSALYSLSVTPVPETPGFPLNVGGETDYFGATVVDIDGNGEHEILVSGRDKTGYALHLFDLNGTDMPGWPRRFDFSPDVQLTTRAVGDLDGDGSLEIVAGSVDYDYETAGGASIFAWHVDGTPVAGWPREIPEAYYCAVGLGDVTGDGRLEIITGTSNPDLFSGAVYVFGHDGTLLPGWPRVNDFFGFTHPSLADLDGDGAMDILFASDSFYVWDYTAAALPGWPRPTNVSYDAPNIGDIDGDGQIEIVVASLSGMMYAWERDGSGVPGWPLRLNGAFSYYTALGDLDGDDDLEFVVAPFLGDGITLLQGDGTPVTTAPIYVPQAQWFGFPRIADIDGRGDAEIMAEVVDSRTGAFSLFAWHLNGIALYGWPISTYGSNYDATVCDVNGDGTLDIVTAQGPYVMSYTFDVPYQRNLNEWPTTHHDLFQTNSYGFEPSQTDVMVSDFTASGTAQGVLLRWMVSGPVDQYMCFILRAPGLRGPFETVPGEISTGKSWTLIDRHITVGDAYVYMLNLTTPDGSERTFGPVEVSWTLPEKYSLAQNYPNPFNPETAISYQLSAVSDQTTHHSPLITLKVYNLLGQEVRTLVEGKKSPGQYTVTWDGRDGRGEDVSSGIYYYRLSVDDGKWAETRSMVLLR